MRRFLLILFLFLILFLPLFINYLILRYTTLPEVKVPDLTGLSSEEAIPYLEKSGLKWKIAGEVYDRILSEGSIVSQKPEGGRKVKAGREIRLVLSSRVKKVIVPNFIGRPVSQVEVVLKELGLRLGEKLEEPSLEYEVGTVISQSPSPETEVEGRTPVDLTIAISGTEEIR